MKLAIDSLVKGQVGFTSRVAEARVFRISPWGWVGAIDENGKQVIIRYPEVIGDPRPVNQRNDVPERLK